MKKRINLIIGLICFGLTSGCIGTDVVEDLALEGQVSILTQVSTIELGTDFQLRASYQNELGMNEEGQVQWSSSDESILEVDDQGLASAKMMGNVTVFAIVDDIRDSLMIEVTDETTIVNRVRMGMFMSRNNYTVQGDLTLEIDEEDLKLSFASNFRASNGPGLFVYLSNSSSGVGGGVEVAQLQSNSGAQNYTIDMSEAELFSYEYVHIYCKPFGVPFGVAQLDR